MTLSQPDPRRSERHLLAALHRWARTNGWRCGCYGWMNPTREFALDARGDSGTVAVWKLTPDADGPEYIDAGSVVQAVDLLVAYGYLPPMWSSAYALAEEKWREQVETLEEEVARVATVPAHHGDTAVNPHAADAESFAHARTDVQALPAEVGRLRAAEARVRGLCDQANADPGDNNGGQFEDPTPIPGWTTLVRRALDGENR